MVICSTQKKIAEYISRLQRHGFDFATDRSFAEDMRLYPKCKVGLRFWHNEWGSKSKFNIDNVKGLKAFLSKNPPQISISAGCCEGAMMFYKERMTLEKPQIVLTATEDYLRNEDWFNNFLTECCEVAEGASEYSAKLYATYKAWAEQNNEYKRSSKDFAAELEKRGFQRKRYNQGMRVSGVRLTVSDEL